MMNKITGYNFDALKSELTVTAEFLKKAGKLNTPEYRIMLQLRRDYPEMKIIQKKVSRKTKPSISCAQMTDFIGKCRDGEKRLKEFERIKELSKIQVSPYCYVRDWFMNHYANYADSEPQFDADGFIIVKTKKELDAEAAAKENEKQGLAFPVTKFENPSNEIAVAA